MLSPIPQQGDTDATTRCQQRCQTAENGLLTSVKHWFGGCEATHAIDAGTGASDVAEIRATDVHRVEIERIGTGASGDRWRVTHAGSVLVPNTRTPFFDGCRALKAMGKTGSVQLWHAGGRFSSMSGEIDRCAELTVEESNRQALRLVAWKPYCTQRFSVPIAAGAVRQGPPFEVGPVFG